MEPTLWDANITRPENYFIELRKEKPEYLGVLSKREVDILRSIAGKYIKKNDFDIADLTKGPEYIPTERGHKNDTSLEWIMEKRLKYDNDKIERRRANLEEQAAVSAFFRK